MEAMIFFYQEKKMKAGRQQKSLGYPINTIENEGSMVIAADGKTAYYASDRSDSRGGLDLYSFELEKIYVPQKHYGSKEKCSIPKQLKAYLLQ